MRRRVLTLVAAAVTAVAPLPSPAASRAGVTSDAHPNAPRKPTVRLTVDTSAMGDEAETTRAWVLRDGAVKLAAAGIDVKEDAADVDVRVSVRPKDLGYTVTLEIWENGAKAPVMTRGPQVCEACTRTEVVKLIEHELAWAGGWLSSPARGDETSEDTAQELVGTDREVESDSSTASTADGRRPRLHALGWAGVGVAAVGVGALTGGLVVALRPYEAKGEPGDYQVPSFEHPQRVGWAMVGIGAVAAVGGAVMIVFDLEKNRTRKLSAGPWLDRQAGGLWVRRSF